MSTESKKWVGELKDCCTNTSDQGAKEGVGKDSEVGVRHGERQWFSKWFRTERLIGGREVVAVKSEC